MTVSTSAARASELNITESVAVPCPVTEPMAVPPTLTAPMSTSTDVPKSSRSVTSPLVTEAVNTAVS